jgi:hypothetical protein
MRIVPQGALDNKDDCQRTLQLVLVMWEGEVMLGGLWCKLRHKKYWHYGFEILDMVVDSSSIVFPGHHAISFKPTNVRYFYHCKKCERQWHREAEDYGL